MLGAVLLSDLAPAFPQGMKEHPDFSGGPSIEAVRRRQRRYDAATGGAVAAATPNLLRRHHHYDVVT